MNFTDVERDVHKLIGLEPNSISRVPPLPLRILTMSRSV